MRKFQHLRTKLHDAILVVTEKTSNDVSDFYDLNCPSEPPSARIPVSKIILCSVSEVFEKMFLDDTEPDKKEYKIDDIDNVEIFKYFIDTMYFDNLICKLNEIQDLEDRIYYIKLCHKYAIKIDLKLILLVEIDISIEHIELYCNTLLTIIGHTPEVSQQIALVAQKYDLSLLPVNIRIIILNMNKCWLLFSKDNRTIKAINMYTKNSKDIKIGFETTVFTVYDDYKLIVLGRNEKIASFNLITGNKLSEFSLYTDNTLNNVCSIAVAHNKNMFALGNTRGKMSIYTQGSLISSINYPNMIMHLCFSNDDTRLICTRLTDDMNLNIRICGTFTLDTILLLSHNGAIKTLYSPDNKFIACQSIHGNIKIWTYDGYEIKNIHVSEAKRNIATKYDFCFTANSKWLAMVYSKYEIRVYRTDSFSEYKTIKVPSSSIELHGLDDDKIAIVIPASHIVITDPISTFCEKIPLITRQK